LTTNRKTPWFLTKLGVWITCGEVSWDGAEKGCVQRRNARVGGCG